MEDLVAAQLTIGVSEPQVAQKRSLVCGGCGYGILRATPPDRCPMCQSENAWMDARPLSLTLLTG
jgi:rubrerythrin